MLQEALQRIQREVRENPKAPYVNYIGAELIKFLRANPDRADHFTSADKSILGGLEAMSKAAEKLKKGNRAMMTPENGMVVVMEYYGIIQGKPEPEHEVKLIELNVDLDALL